MCKFIKKILEPVEAWEVEEVVRFYRISHRDALWMLAQTPKVERQKHLLTLENLKKLTPDDNDQQFQDLKELLHKNHRRVIEPVKLPFSLTFKYPQEELTRQKQLAEAWNEYLSKPYESRYSWDQFFSELKAKGLTL